MALQISPTKFALIQGRRQPQPRTTHRIKVLDHLSVLTLLSILINQQAGYAAIGLTDRYMGGYPILIPMFGSEVTILGLAPGYRNRTGRSHTERWYVRVVDGHIGKSTSVGRSEDDVTTE